MENLFPLEHKPRVLPIDEVIEETPKVKSLYLEYPELASKSIPGQFVMVWVIGVDEIPIAVSSARIDGTIGLTIEKVGDATSKIHELEVGDMIGVRGPYGNGFDISGDKILIVGGGCGISPLVFLAEEAVSLGKEVTFVLLAKDVDNLLFKSRLDKLRINLVIGTEDGSAGIKGITGDVLRKADLDWDFDSCIVCGPEKMMIATARLIEGREIPVQVSLDRYMKCGIGICGQCSIDPSGLRVCKEGPVFRYSMIEDGEFGEYKRDVTGRIVKF